MNNCHLTHFAVLHILCVFTTSASIYSEDEFISITCASFNHILAPHNQFIQVVFVCRYRHTQ